jgi:hypothetical protein
MARKRGFRESRLEQLDGVAGRIVHQDLFTADSGDNVVAKVRSRRPQSRDDFRKVGDLYGKSIPASWFGLRAIRHRLTAAARWVWCAEYETQVVSRKHGEGRCGMHVFMKTKLLTVERNRGVDIVNDVPDLHCGHFESHSLRFRAPASAGDAAASARPLVQNHLRGRVATVRSGNAGKGVPSGTSLGHVADFVPRSLPRRLPPVRRGGRGRAGASVGIALGIAVKAVAIRPIALDGDK